MIDNYIIKTSATISISLDPFGDAISVLWKFVKKFSVNFKRIEKIYYQWVTNWLVEPIINLYSWLMKYKWSYAMHIFFHVLSSTAFIENKQTKKNIIKSKLRCVNVIIF